MTQAEMNRRHLGRLYGYIAEALTDPLSLITLTSDTGRINMPCRPPSPKPRLSVFARCRGCGANGLSDQPCAYCGSPLREEM